MGCRFNQLSLLLHYYLRGKVLWLFGWVACLHSFLKKIRLSSEKRTALWFYYSDYHSCMFIYLWSIICDCAKEAERKGYRVFGIQFYGECWGSHSFIPSRRYRPVRRCIDEQFKKCATNGSNRTCTGENWTNFIYKLQQVCVWFTFACFFIDNFEVCAGSVKIAKTVLWDEFGPRLLARLFNSHQHTRQ